MEADRAPLQRRTCIKGLLGSPDWGTDRGRTEANGSSLAPRRNSNWDSRGPRRLQSASIGRNIYCYINNWRGDTNEQGGPPESKRRNPGGPAHRDRPFAEHRQDPRLPVEARRDDVGGDREGDRTPPARGQHRDAGTASSPT